MTDEDAPVEFVASFGFARDRISVLTWPDAVGWLFPGGRVFVTTQRIVFLTYWSLS